MAIDRPDGDEGHAVDGSPGVAPRGSVDGRSRGSGAPEGTAASGADSSRLARNAEHRASADAAYRAYAIDRAYEKVSEIERGVVTPAMKRIEGEDPERQLAGLENRLKGKERLAEKVISNLQSNPELSYDQASAKVKDAIRYTFVYNDEHYAEGVRADSERLASRFELVDLRNLWAAAEYKGINTRWRVPESHQVFEIQFHTHASLEAKQFTHGAYEKIRDPCTPRDERDKLQEFQRQVSADIPVPRDAIDIRDYP